MASEGTLHDVTDRLNVALKVENGKLVGKVAETGEPVGEKDRILLRENASLWVATDDFVRYGQIPTKLYCCLYLWQEPEGQEQFQKDLASAIKVEAWRENNESVVPGGGIQTFFDGDLQVNMGPGGALMTHIAGKRAHAHYQFEIVFRFEDQFVWDPDVHDVPPT